MKMKEAHQTHEFEPAYDADSQILILGSFPSVKSREIGFYYGHPKNRFWKLLAALYETDEPVLVPEKKLFLKKYHIALWDVIESCDITGSSDSSIRNVKLNDINRILKAADIQAVYANGKKAETLYRKYMEPLTGRKIISLPSTSPANAAYSMERLMESWKQILRV